MSQSVESLLERLRDRFGDALTGSTLDRGQVTIEVAADRALEIFTALRDEAEFAFEQLMDVAGVDYAAYGKTEWATETTTFVGFGRAVEPTTSGRSEEVVRRLGEDADRSKRFAAAYQLQSIARNQRLRVRVYAPDDELPVVPSVVDIWNSANWYEREAFDLFGIVFEGHPDLRRILTDYGFVGHPFRKDFPLIGNVEMRYDPEQGRVVYQPVSIESRSLVPRVIRDDFRYLGDGREESADNA